MDIGPFVDAHERPAPPSSQELADAWGPWIETCIERFGADRCMFESNFPVDKVSNGYATLWNAFKLMAAGASAAEKTCSAARPSASTTSMIFRTAGFQPAHD